jgi:hypothetical protein
MRNVPSRRPSAAMIVAVIALVAALGGTAIAAKKLGLGSLSAKAKKKTVGVGKLTYVTAQQAYTGGNPPEGYVLTATCPDGTHVLGGGAKVASGYAPNFTFSQIEDYLSANGFTARFYAGDTGVTDTVAVTASCGISQAVTGSPPAP